MMLYYGQKIRVWYKGVWIKAKRQLYLAMVTDRVQDLATCNRGVNVQIHFKTGGKGIIKHNCVVAPGDVKV